MSDTPRTDAACRSCSIPIPRPLQLTCERMEKELAAMKSEREDLQTTLNFLESDGDKMRAVIATLEEAQKNRKLLHEVQCAMIEDLQADKERMDWLETPLAITWQLFTNDDAITREAIDAARK